MTTFTCSVATAETFDLGEGVIWDDRAQLVRWVDIREGRVLAGRMVGDQIQLVDDRHIGQTVGAVALADDGGLLLAAAHSLATVSPEGELSFGPNLHQFVGGDARGPWRLNDGIVDPHGRFVVGTLSLDEAAHSADEVLLRISPNGLVEVLRTEIGMSNGLGFSPDGSTIFHIDTLAGTLSTHSYARDEFDVDEPWQIVIDDFPFLPDGMTVDAEGDLWIAFWGGSQVARYSPDGRLTGEVAVNATQPTCAGFVGETLNRLAITSARKGLSTTTDDAGALFLGDAGVVGKQEFRWMGSTTRPFWKPERRSE
jgi:sugar lactone lactonase YvrE